MTVILPPTPVAGPEPRAVRYGLFTAALGPLPLPEHGLAGGLVYEPVSCGYSRIYPASCHTDERRTVKTFDGENEAVEALPFVVYSTLQCGAAGKTSSDLEAKVRRRLANGEQTSAEAGMAAILASGATPVTPPGITLSDTIGELEQWLYGINPSGQNYGYVGCLHCSPRIAAYAALEDLIVQDSGPLLRTRMGTVWSFGGGYPDDGTIYISGQPTIWKSEDIYVPDPVQTFDRSANQWMLVAEREYAVAYDCLAASATFNWGIAS